MERSKIYLGHVKKDYEDFGIAGYNLFLYKHKLAPGDYWQFGEVGNNGFAKGCIPSFETLFVGNTTPASQVFYEPQFIESAWVIICETMRAAYSLHRATKAYFYPVDTAGLVDFIASPFMVQRLMADLEKLLDELWEYMLKDNKTTRLKEAIDLQEKKVEDLKTQLAEVYRKRNELSEGCSKADAELKGLRADLPCVNSPPKA